MNFMEWFCALYIIICFGIMVLLTSRKEKQGLVAFDYMKPFMAVYALALLTLGLYIFNVFQ